MTQHGTIMLVMLLMTKMLVKLLMMLMKHTLAGHTSDPACHYHAGGCALAFANTAWLKYHRDHYVDDGFHGDDGEHEGAPIMLSEI